MCMPSMGKAHGALVNGCQLLSPPALGRILFWAGLQGPHGSCPRQTQHFSLPEPGNPAALAVFTLADVEASSAPAPALALPDRSKLQGHRVRCGRAVSAEPGGGDNHHL